MEFGWNFTRVWDDNDCEEHVTISFIPSGLCLGHLFFLPWTHPTLYDDFHVWPYFTFLFATVTTASIISIIKLSNGKYVFEHFVYLLAASLLFIIAGTLFVVLTIEHTEVALFINSAASGVVTIAGLSYVNIRAMKHERPLRIAICHLWKLFGFAAAFTIYLFLFHDIDANNQVLREEKLREFYQIFGSSLIGSTAVFLLMLGMNELLQRQGLIYNYRDCLDHDNSIANNYCKLFSHNEVVIERNTTVSAAGLWKSAENLLPRHKNTIYTTLWTLYMLIPKLHGAIFFHYFLLTMSMNTAALSFDTIDYVHGITLWLMLVEAFIGCALLRFVHSKKVFVTTSCAAVVAIGVAIAFFGRWPPSEVAVCLWIYFAFLAIALPIPDIALLEMSKIRYNEGVLAAGYFVEIIPIAVLQLTHRNAHTLTQLQWYTDKYFVAYAVASIVVLLVASAIYVLHMPDTHAKSLLQIQNELLKRKSYFAFIDEGAVGGDTKRDDFMRESEYVVDARNRSAFEAGSMHDDDVLPPVNNGGAKSRYDMYCDLPAPSTMIPRANLVRTPTSDSKK